MDLNMVGDTFLEVAEIMLTKYITNPTENLVIIDWMPLAFAKLLLMRSTTCTERVCRLEHY